MWQHPIRHWFLQKEEEEAMSELSPGSAWQVETDFQNASEMQTKHCVLEKSFLDPLHLAKWKGNITGNAHPMV